MIRCFDDVWLLKKDYNVYEAQIEALKELVMKFDIMVKNVTENGM